MPMQISETGVDAHNDDVLLPEQMAITAKSRLTVIRTVWEKRRGNEVSLRQLT